MGWTLMKCCFLSMASVYLLLSKTEYISNWVWESDPGQEGLFYNVQKTIYDARN